MTPAALLLLQAVATGSITGTLRDATTGTALGGVLVSVLDLNRTAVTDADGRYTLTRVPAGGHRLLVRRIGYAPRTLAALIPADGTVEIAIELRAEPVVLSPVDGSDGPELLAPDARVDIASLRSHPLLAEPDAFQALGGGVVALQPEAPAGMHVRGGAADQVAYVLDGFPILSPYHSGESFSAWNPDALAEAELRPASETWDALSGVVAASSRAVGAEHHVQTGLSTTQARVTLDGPLASSGAGYLWSYRTSFPGFPAPQREATYLRGETGDQLGKLEATFGGGQLRLLGYASTNELNTDGPTGDALMRNTFGWQSTTFGAGWRRPLRTGSLEVRAWSAGQNADAAWHLDSTRAERLAANRRDAGLAIVLEHVSQQGRSALGMRIQSSRTAYHLIPDSAAGVTYATDAPLVAVFLERSHRFGSRWEMRSTLGGTAAAGTARLSPRLSLGWSPSSALVVSAGYLRLYQFAQSLRNPESVASTVFPVDLFVSAGKSGIPVARTDEGILAAQYEPIAGLRVAAQGYVRSLHDVVLVAPQSVDPFATGQFAIGSGVARGFAINLARATARYTAFASYGRQFVRYRDLSQRYVPDFGATDLADAAISVNASQTLSVRAGMSGRFGRRITPLATPFEWESCNVADRGCEFAGSPRTTGDSLGVTAVPGYVRFDIGIRSRWRLRIAGRTTELAVFGTLTNVFARTNMLTLAPDPITGARAPVTLRSRVPLVIGVDWSF